MGGAWRLVGRGNLNKGGKSLRGAALRLWLKAWD